MLDRFSRRPSRGRLPVRGPRHVRWLERARNLETLVASAVKTGRVVITHEAPVTGGFGGESAARIAEQAFGHLHAPIRRVCGSATLPFEALLDLEARNQRAVGRSDDVKEGIRAFRERRKPDFRRR